jgi:hypothetical protein
LLVFHELAVIFGSGASAEAGTVVAYRWIEQGMDAFGLVNAAPAILTLALLVVWHFRRGDTFELSPLTPALMAVESACWTIPLLIAQSVVGRALLAGADGVGGPGIAGAMSLSIGAGLYEELLFRVVLVGGVAWVLREIIGLPVMSAAVVAVVLSSILFAMYHDLGPGGQADSTGLFVLYFIGGLYFGVLFLARGFGIAAAAHAMYDMVVLAIAGVAAS